MQDWLGPVTFRQQAEGDLGERLLAASAPEPVMFLGTDAPDLSPGLLHQAADGLVAAPCAIVIDTAPAPMPFSINPASIGGAI